MAISDCHLCNRKCWLRRGVLGCGVARVDIVEMQARGCPLGVFAAGGGPAMGPPAAIPDDYVPTPTNATAGGCGCKK